jgi:hypothetical protein
MPHSTAAAPYLRRDPAGIARASERHGAFYDRVPTASASSSKLMRCEARPLRASSTSSRRTASATEVEREDVAEVIAASDVDADAIEIEGSSTARAEERGNAHDGFQRGPGRALAVQRPPRSTCSPISSTSPRSQNGSDAADERPSQNYALL